MNLPTTYTRAEVEALEAELSAAAGRCLTLQSELDEMTRSYVAGLQHVLALVALADRVINDTEADIEHCPALLDARRWLKPPATT